MVYCRHLPPKRETGPLDVVQLSWKTFLVLWVFLSALDAERCRSVTPDRDSAADPEAGGSRRLLGMNVATVMDVGVSIGRSLPFRQGQPR